MRLTMLSEEIACRNGTTGSSTCKLGYEFSWNTELSRIHDFQKYINQCKWMLDKFPIYRRLPYTEATMREAMRIQTLTPWSVFHRTKEATTLMGYDIPGGTIVITNLSHMHNDPDFWGDPENFRPERFLTEDGERLAKDFTLPFGLGKIE